MCVDQQDGQARLVGGSADAGGTWEYGRLEVLVDSVWSFINEVGTELGRRGAQVACRSLGYATGAQLLVGESSPFPAAEAAPELVRDIVCNGSEDSLADCRISVDYSDFQSYFVRDPSPDAVALVCTTPSGASSEHLSDQSAVPSPMANSSINCQCSSETRSEGRHCVVCPTIYRPPGPKHACPVVGGQYKS